MNSINNISKTFPKCELNYSYARRPAGVMHFAAYIDVGESVKNPSLYYHNNISGSVSLLKTIIDVAAVPIVFSSTAAVYGVPRSLPISENHPTDPINPYGYSKLVIERMLADLERAHGLRSISLRYFNAAGADPDGEIGKNHEPETNLIPVVLKAARQDSTVSIYGNDYDTPDGTCIRDYVHVVDIADAHVRAINYLLNGGTSCTLNLANACGYSVIEVIKTAERVCRKSIKSKVAPRRIGDPPVARSIRRNPRRCSSDAINQRLIEEGLRPVGQVCTPRVTPTASTTQIHCHSSPLSSVSRRHCQPTPAASSLFQCPISRMCSTAAMSVMWSSASFSTTRSSRSLLRICGA